MFDNIGEKIKTLAVVCTVIGIVASLIVGLVAFSLNVGIGFLIIVAGVLVSWIGSFFVYGFGQLISNTDALVSANKGINSEEKESPTSSFKAENLSSETATESEWRLCPHCGGSFKSDKTTAVCPWCEKEIKIEFTDSDQSTPQTDTSNLSSKQKIQLRELEEWRSNGWISEQEYEQRKKEILK